MAPEAFDLHKRIIPSLDTRDLDSAQAVIDAIGPDVFAYKIGYSLIFNRNVGLGDALDMLEVNGVRAMIDAKMFDITNTMLSGIDSMLGNIDDSDLQAAIGFAKPRLITIHCSVGATALKKVNQAVMAANQRYGSNTELVGVTVLTSYDDSDCLSIYGEPVGPTVQKFASFAVDAGLANIVSSGQDIGYLQADEYTKLTKNVLGIRPSWAPINDQVRSLTPSQALLAGADRLVIGRPLIDPPEEIDGTRQAYELILQEMESITW